MKEQARQTFAAAFAAARQHDDAEPDYNYDKDFVLSQIADAQTDSGLLSDAAATADMIRAPVDQGKTLVNLIRAQITAGLLDQALMEARKITLDDDRSYAFGEIAVGQAKAGQTERARQTFAQALGIVKSRKHASECDYARHTTIELEAGFFADAATTADNVKQPRPKIDVLCALGRAEAKRRRGGAAAQHFEAGAALVAQVEDKQKSRAFVQIAAAQADAQMPAEAMRTFRQAVVAAVKQGDVNGLVDEVAAEQVKAGIAFEAMETLGQAAALAADLDAAEQWQAFTKIAAAQAKAGRKDEANKTFGAAIAAAAHLRKQKDRTDAAFAIAAAQFSADLLPDSLSTIRAIRDEKAADETAVLEIVCLAELKRFDEALARAREHTCEFHRVWSFFYIAAREIQARKLEASRRLLAEAMAACRTTDHYEENDFSECDLNDIPLSFMDSVIATVAQAQASAGLAADASTTARLLDNADNRTQLLVAIAKAQIESRYVDQAMATIAEAKAEARNIKEAETTSKIFAQIAELQAKTGGMQEARRSFAEALAAAQTIRFTGGFLSNARLPKVVKGEMGAGLFAEAAESCRAMADSDAKDSLFEEIARRENYARIAKEAKTIVDKKGPSPAPSDRQVQGESVRLLVEAGRFTEALAAAHKMAEITDKETALSEIATGQSLAKQRGPLRETVVEWLAIARQLDDPGHQEQRLSRITLYLAELGMARELEQTLAERLAAARQMEAKGILISSPFGFSGNGQISPLAEVAVDQATYGRLGDALTTTGTIKDAHLRFRTLHTILDNHQGEKSTTEIRQVFVDALTAAREDAENQADDFTDVAELQADAGLDKEADETLAELLSSVRKIEDLEERVSGLCKVARGRSGVSKHSLVWAKSVAEADKSRARPVFQEAIATAMRIEAKKRRERALQETIQSQADAGLLPDAVEASRHIEDPNDRAGCLVRIVPWHAEGEDAARILAEAFEVAKTIPDSRWRDVKMRWVVGAAANVRLFADALAMARGMDAGGEKIDAMCEIAKAQCEAGQKDDGRRTFAEACMLGQEKQRATVVIAQAKAGLPAEALLEARKIDDAAQRASALREVALVLATAEKAKGK